MPRIRYSKAEQTQFRQWLELHDRPRNLPAIQIYEHIDVANNNQHLPVIIDETGNLFVGDELALVNKKRIPNIRHNISWGLSHTPFRQLYGLPQPYSRFTYAKSPVTVHHLSEIFGMNITPAKFWNAYWFSYILYQRQVLRRYIADNGRRLKWVGAYANPDFRQRKSIFLFPSSG